MRKALAFVKAVVNDWVATMSGSVGLLLAFAAKFVKSDKVPDEWLWSACAVCLAVAMYRAWSQEFDRAERATPAVDGVLYRENLQHRKTIETQQMAIAALQQQMAKDKPRRLDEQQIATITEALRNGLNEFARTCRLNGATSADDGVAIQLTAIGLERETANYRDDFKKSFEAAGFFTQLQDSEVSAPDTMPYVSVVTVLAESRSNTIRPFVIEALRSAGVPVKEGGFSVPYQMYRTYEDNLHKQVFTRLIIGPRV